MTQEMLEKAKQAKSAEELLALAKENGIELTDERAREVFNSLHSSAELADEELGNVSGGGCTPPGETKFAAVCVSCGYKATVEIKNEDIEEKRAHDARFLCPSCRGDMKVQW